MTELDPRSASPADPAPDEGLSPRAAAEAKKAEEEAAEAQMATLEREQCIMTQAGMKAFVPDEMVFWSEE